jgi:hypothetical protein
MSSIATATDPAANTATRTGAHRTTAPSLQREACFMSMSGTLSMHGTAIKTDVWFGGNGHAPGSQDDYLIDPRHSGVLRLAVLDGVTPFERKGPAGIDQAVWAAGVTRTMVRNIGEPRQLLEDAHAELFQEDTYLSRHRPGTAVAVADVTISEGHLNVDAASAADCSVWVRHGEHWKEIVGGDHLSAQARTSWEQWKREHADIEEEMLGLAEALLLDDEENRESPAIGRDTDLKPRSASIEGADEVVICTDGARLDPTSLNDLEAHINGFIRETDRGDVTVIRVRLA